MSLEYFFQFWFNIKPGEIMAKHSRFGSFAVVLTLLLALPLQSFAHPRQMEAIDRGLVVSNVGKAGVLVSWRLLGTEGSDTEFNLYRDGVKIASIGKTAGTNYLDSAGKVSSKYTVAAVVGGKEGSKSAPSLVLDSSIVDHGKSFPYKVLKLDRPASQTMPDSANTVCGYYPDDMSVGDLDGDGEYELIVKWFPDNFKDNSQSMVGSYTGTVFLDAYKLDGKKLWRISLGRNIRAGAHYTPFQVYDYDGDGKAEIVMKTGDGTIDGKGKVIGDSSKDYRNASGIIITGPEYLTVFRGSDGAEITTIDYVPSRDIRNFGSYDSLGLNWGDTYGNRCDRFLSATAYLDGVHPSLIIARGYYTAAYVVAYDFDGKNLKQRWFHKSETPGEGLFGQGNLNIVVGDLDRDGKDEIVYGAAALNSDGTVRYSTGLGYGYAAYVGDFDPDHAGLEVWAIHSHFDSTRYVAELRDDKGKFLFGDLSPMQKENGRAMAADIDSTSRGYELWSYVPSEMHSAKGTPIKLSDTLDPEYPYLGRMIPTSFRIYFDGDLQDELLNGPVVSKFNQQNRKIETYFDGETSLGLIGNQSAKNYPNLVADLFGDWREEMIFRSERDSSKIYILSTPVTTPHRLYTLMHDAQYRQAVAWQNTAYNLAPHPGYYLPDMVKKLTKPNVYAAGENEYAVYPDAVLTKTGNVSEKQTINLGESIKEIGYSYMFCTGVKAEGLPAGVTAKVDSASQTVKVSGKPTKAGTFAFTLSTVGSKAKNVSLTGEFIVKDTVKIDTTKKDTAKVDTAKVDTTKKDTVKVDTAKVDTAKVDTTKKDTTKVDTAKVDTTKRDTAKVDTTKKDTSKVDTTKKDNPEVVTVGSSIVDAAFPFEGEGETETENDGFIGKGFFDFKNSTSSYATWLVKSPKEDSTTLSIRYSNGDSVSRDMKLVVNDKEIGIVKMSKTSNWSVWNTSSVKIKLKKGKNTITLKSTVKSGGANVDAFLFDIAGVEAYKNSESLPVVQFGSGFYYRPATGVLFSPVSGFVEILFYDISGTMRAAISSHVTVGENEVVLDRGVLSKGMYVVKVKLDGKLMQKGLFNKMNN